MCDIDRRDFIKIGSAGAAAMSIGGVSAPTAAISSDSGSEMVTPKAFHQRLNDSGISMREPRSDGRFIIQVNETWGTTTAEDLFTKIQSALG